MIRLVKPQEDVQDIVKIYAPFCTSSATTFENVPPTQYQMRERIQKLADALPFFVYEEDNQVIGYAYSSIHKDRAAYRWSVDVSIYLAESARWKGIGTKLYTRLFVELRELGFYNAYAGVTLPNRASVGLHEKLGFVRVGVYKNVGYKLGKWHDVAWYHLVLKEHEHNPVEPQAWAAAAL